MASGGGDTISHYTGIPPGRRELREKGIGGQAFPHQAQLYVDLTGRDKQTGVELYPTASMPSQPQGGSAWHKHGGDSFPVRLEHDVEGGSDASRQPAPLPVQPTDRPEVRYLLF